MGRLFYDATELLKRPLYPGMRDPTHLYYHFRPARPANLVVTRDPLSGEINVAAGTYGLLTDRPYTVCLHISKHSYDSARNLQSPGTECVVALPGRDRVVETWFTSLPIPRGISEAEVGELTLLPSHEIDVPGIAECPVNLECRVERVKDWHTHYAVFLRVVGAGVDEEYLALSREAVIQSYPTYEVDDQTNAFGGSIERLGVNGELLVCPGFPVGAKRGGRAGPEAWVDDLRADRYLSAVEAAKMHGWLRRWGSLDEREAGSVREQTRRLLARALELAAWEEWDALHAHLAEEERPSSPDRLDIELGDPGTHGKKNPVPREPPPRKPARSGPSKVYWTEAELDALHEAADVPAPAAYTLGAPMPQVLLVTVDASFGDGALSVRTSTLTPLSWGPYTKAVSIPLDDEVVVRALRRPNAQCVLGLPSRDMLRQLTICAQRLPPGLSEADVARLETHKSLHVDVPSLQDCPVNFECVVEHLETYHDHLVAFLRVVGASIDDRMLFLERDEIVSLYPTNYADEIVDRDGAVRMRVSLLSDLYLCPTFPVAPKKGWYGTFALWMRDLADEGYLSGGEVEQVMTWLCRWQALFADLESTERAALRTKLTELIRLIARERWPELHTYLSKE